jgi:hypothetical protein
MQPVSPDQLPRTVDGGFTLDPLYARIDPSYQPSPALRRKRSFHSTCVVCRSVWAQQREALSEGAAAAIMLTPDEEELLNPTQLSLFLEE